MSNIIYLNVGGTKYTTTRSTLCKYPDSMLGRMFSPDSPFTLNKDIKDNVFLDANGDIFKYVLDYLRYNIAPEGPMINRFKIELDYFQIPHVSQKEENPKLRDAKAMLDKTLNPDLNRVEQEQLEKILNLVAIEANNTKRDAMIKFTMDNKLSISKVKDKLIRMGYQICEYPDHTVLRLTW